jgi:hypothetical protein
MFTQKIKISVKVDGVEPPIFKEGSDWIDLRSSVDVNTNDSHVIVPLGISVKLPAGTEAIIAPRSSSYKKFNISLLAYVLCAIMIIIIIPCVSDISGDVFRSKGRMSGYEEDSLYNDFIENNYEGLLEKTEYNTGIGKDIDKDTQDYYTFAIAYKKAVDYRVYVNNGENEKAEQVVKDIDNAQFNNVLFKEALENVKNIYISNGLSQ